MRRTWSHGYVIAAVMGAAVLAMYWQLWLPLGDAQRTLRWDALWEYWGDLQIQVRALERAQWPLWNPHERMGYPFYADPQAGTLYPVQWGLIAAGRLMGEVPYWFIAVKNLFHIWLLGLGMALWLRRQGMAPAAYYLGALLMLASYSVVANAPSALNWSFAYTPWLLLTGERLLERPGWSTALEVGVVAALMVAAGALGAAWYAVVIAAPWLGWQLGARLLRGGGAYARDVALCVAFAAIVAASLCGVQVWATLDVLPETERSMRGADFYTQSGMTARDLANLALPWRQGIPVYLGIAPMLLAIAALATVSLRRQLVWWGLLALGIVFSLGAATPLLGWAAAVAPPIEWFRMAHRYLYVASFAFAVLGAWGLSGIAVKMDVKGESSRRWRDVARWGAVAVVVVCCAEQYVARYAVVRDSTAKVPALARDGLARDYLATHADARVYDRGWIGYRPGARLGLRDFAGYEDDPLALVRYARVRNWLRKDPNMAGRVGVAYLGFDLATRRLWPFSPQPREMHEVAPMWFAYNDVAANARWTPAAQVAPDADAAFAAFSSANARMSEGLGAGMGATTSASPTFVEAAHAAFVPTGHARATEADVAAAMTAFAENVVVYRVQAPTTGLLVTSEMYVTRGWSATVNSKPAAIAAINGYARGVKVPAGEVVVQMTFDLPAYRHAALATVGAWVVALLALCGLRLGRRG